MNSVFVARKFKKKISSASIIPQQLQRIKNLDEIIEKTIQPVNLGPPSKILKKNMKNLENLIQMRIESEKLSKDHS